MVRNYSKQSFLNETSVRVSYHENGNVTYDDFVGPALMVSSDVSNAGLSVNTPNFKKLKVKPLNPFQFVANEFRDPLVDTFVVKSWGGPGSPRQTQVYRTNAVRQGADLSPPGLPSWIDDMSFRQATNGLLQRLNTAKASTLVTLAEIHKTANHIAHTATRLASAIHALRRFDPVGVATSLGIAVSKRDTKRVYARKRAYQGLPMYERKIESRKLDFMGDAWLEYAYGWKPMLNDVYDHAEALADVMTEKSGIIGRASYRSHVSEKWPTFVTRDDQYTKCTKGGNFKCSHTYVIYYSNEQVSTANTFGLQNPLVVAWELVPFSFVADWFIPIGSALENLTATNGLTFHSGTLSRKTEIDIWADVLGKSAGDEYFNYSGYAKGTRKDVTVYRSVLSTFPSAQMPSFKDPRSISHMTSALALLNSLFLKGKK